MVKKLRFSLRRRTRWGESLIQGFLFFCGAFSILTTLGIVYELGKEALLFFRNPAVKLLQVFHRNEMAAPGRGIRYPSTGQLHFDHHRHCHADRFTARAGSSNLPE